MKRYLIPFGLLTVCALAAGCCATAPPTDDQPGSDQTAYGVGGRAQLFEGMGAFHRPVTTRSRAAQRYFDQGLTWLYGFNHDEAVRSFKKAAELDPSCAMAWWGAAYAQGPYYNAPRMNEARRAAAWDAARRALAELDDESPVEHALVHALTRRYQDPEAEDRRNQNELRASFADAMAAIWAEHPSDADVGTLYAEAMMVMHPWNLYKADGAPAREQTLTITATLESVFVFAPNHPGANHLYLHAVEASNDKARAIPAADRLSRLVPASGHLTHMPSHLYVQVGMWDRAVEQNTLAMRADRRYLERSPTQFRQHGYIAHNGHMLAFAAMMVGRERDAMAGAEAAWQIPGPLLDTIGRRYDRAVASRYEVMRRFGRWDALLAEPAPPTALRRTTAVWRACRAIAFAANKDFVNARAEHAAYQVLLADRPNDKFLLLNDRFIAAEIALQQEEWDDAVALLEEAIGYEDALRYSEPPIWVQPVRHTLGAVLLKTGRFADAERVYREDLERWPNNGWSLFGLARALESQGKVREASAARSAFDRAWASADSPLGTSCKCIPDL